MKKLLTLFFLLPLFVLAQGVVNCTLTVRNNQGGVMANTPITLIETTTKERIAKSTDGMGVARFEITSGKEWKIQILQIDNMGLIQVPENGRSTKSKMFTYDYKNYERTHRSPVNRKALNLTTVDVTKQIATGINKQHATVRLFIKKEDKTPLANFPVALTCYKLKTTFLSATNDKGFAVFSVPINNEFEMDIDGVESFSYLDVLESGQYEQDLTYEPTAIKEITKNDTIKQTFKTRATGTSGRTLVDLTIKCTDCENMAKEPIYIQEVGGSKVYTANLNTEGNVVFLLPIKKKYLISFKYDFDVDVINLSDIVGISSKKALITYKPRPELKYPERYLVSPSSFIRSDIENYIPEIIKSNNESPIAIKLKWGNENVNATSKEALLSLQLSVKVPKNSPYVCPPINVAFVLDKSGSMEGDERIGSLKASMLNYSNLLRPTDRVSLVSFDNDAKVIMPTQLLGNKAYFVDMVKDLQANGGTNIYAGLQKGYEEVLKNVKPKQVNRVILLTDGYDGIPVDSTVNMSKSYNNKGIQVSAIGVGDDYNYALLNLLALNGGGALRLSPKPKDLNIVIQQELGSMINSVGSNARVKISFGNEFSCKETFGMPLKKESDKLYSANYEVLFDGQNNLGLLKFDLKNCTKQIEKTPVTVSIIYYDMLQKKDITIEENMYLKWQDANGEIDFILDSYMKKLYSIAYVNHALKTMDDNFVNQKYTSLKEDVQNLVKKLEYYYAQPADKDIVQLLRSLKKYTTSVDFVVKSKKLK